MDVNNVVVVINAIPTNNPLIEWVLSIIENSLISILGGLFAAIISVYITIEYTVIKGDALKFNKVMIKVIFEIKTIKRKMEIDFFNKQIEKMKKKAEQKKNGVYIWVGFDKEDYYESFIARYQFLPIYWLSIFFMQALEIFTPDDHILAEKIQSLNVECHN